jgi:FMN phosphatase YigB (HAD superfamily)
MAGKIRGYYFFHTIKDLFAFMTIKATIWDFSGVLVQPTSRDPHADLARELGIPPETLMQYFDGTQNWKIDRGLETQADYIRRMVREQNLAPGAFDLISNFFLTRYVLGERLIAFIRSTRPALKTALCSNFSDVLRQHINERWGIADLFDVTVISSEVGLIKPEPGIYHLTLDKLGVQPGEAILVDDQEKNILGARAIGMHGIVFENTDETIRQVKEIIRSADN